MRRVGAYVIRETRSPSDIQRVQKLRADCFGLKTTLDICVHDPLCSHVLIESSDESALLGCFRMRLLQGAEVLGSYAARYYDLARLAVYDKTMLEIGRFCVAPQAPQADVLRLAWHMIAARIARADVGLVFGCTSFAGTDPGRYANAFVYLDARHLAPDSWAPGVKAARIIPLVEHAGPAPSTHAALREMPGLLRSYLKMGAWVSDHAVVDPHLDTLHVFTGLETDTVPPARRRRLAEMLSPQRSGPGGS